MAKFIIDVAVFIWGLPEELRKLYPSGEVFSGRVPEADDDAGHRPEQPVPREIGDREGREDRELQDEEVAEVGKRERELHRIDLFLFCFSTSWKKKRLSVSIQKST